MFTRTLSKHLDHITKNFPVVLITGPRQVGKSTLLENYNPQKYHEVTLDNLDEREKAIKDPALFLQDHQPPVLIDEIQYAPQLFSYIKIYVDQHKGQNGLFLLTGSQKFHLMKGVQETLAGRVAVLDLLGLSNKEINHAETYIPFLPTDEYIQNLKQTKIQSKTVYDVFTDIWNGSFPALINQNGEDRNIYYSSYVKTYLDRDVKGSYNVMDTLTFNNFVKAVAARTGQLLNFSDIAKDVAIDSKTAKAWLNILETSGLVYLLHPYYNNVTNRIIKTPKLYFLDTGLCAYLTGWDSPKSLEAGAMSGAILETYAFTEILKSYWHNATEPNIYFYRDKEKQEIDFIIESNDTLYPIEIKKTMMPSPALEKGFEPIKNLKRNLGKNIILSLKPEISSLNWNTISIPLWML